MTALPPDTHSPLATSTASGATRFAGWLRGLLGTAALGLFVLGGCARPYVTIPEPSADQIPELEARAATAPEDVTTLTHLGAAYREAGRSEEARATLDRARELAPSEPLPVVLLGMAYEDLERYTAARELYEEYLALVPDTPIRGRIEGRIDLMRRHELEALVSDALARESELADAPSPTTVAVFPFRFQGSDPELRPLGHALAGMVATDLAQVDRFTLLERMHLDALMEEIQMGGTDLVNPATAARSGRLVGAGRIVQGRLGGDEGSLRLDAAVVRVTGTDPEVSPVSQEDALERLFDMEKELVMGIIDAMGVTLTAAERERVLDRRTDDLQALLAYGRGLEAAQNGDYREAARHFRQAASLDPDFDAARTESQEAEGMADAAEPADRDLVGEAVRAIEVPSVRDAVEIVESAARRDAAQEALGTEGARPTVILELILRRPGGGR